MMPLCVNLVEMHGRFASTLGLILLAATAAAAEPMTSRHEPLPDQVWAEMQGSSWHPNRGCPPREALALLTVPYRDFAGETRRGRLVFAKRVANQVASIFTEIFESQKFRIERMELVDKYRGDDDASMAANNTSAFNCRFVAGTKVLSAHALGIAIDINPEQNPWVDGADTAPPKGRAFDRPSKRQSAHRRGQPGIIMQGDVVVRAFKQQGWKWGGDWSSKKDYQHFSENGR
jgi:D-alanyl-D-alanine carboxypeptidase